MTVSWWIAHILAVHLSVPEPVTYKMLPALYPSENWAQVRRVPEGISGGAWVIEIDEQRWRKMKGNEQLWLVAHELCHAAFGDDQTEWGKMDKKERKKKHDEVIIPCANKILRDHYEER